MKLARFMKQQGMEFYMDVLMILFGIAGLILFFMGFTTGYYIFGEMNSIQILVLILGAILMEMLCIFLGERFADKAWTRVLTLIVTALLAAAAIMLIGDRVEGIGNCIVTDYDSGHGGEEAIYCSLVSSVLLLLAMILNIVGSFGHLKKMPTREKEEA